MIKYKASERKVDLYDIGDGLTLMNIILKNEDGKMRSIDTYIGTDRNGFSCVGHTEGLDEPGVIFSYSRYVRMIEANLSYYLDAFFTNTNPRVTIGRLAKYANPGLMEKEAGAMEKAMINKHEKTD